MCEKTNALYTALYYNTGLIYYYDTFHICKIQWNMNKYDDDYDCEEAMNKFSGAEKISV